MAASTANMVKSSSGKLYEPDSPQGKMIRSGGGTRAISEETGEQGVFGQILDSLKSANSLLFQIDNNTEESESEKRNRKVQAENTDNKSGMLSGMMGGIGSGLKGVGGALNKVNPFQEGGLGTKMSIALLAGVLFAISKFGDKLIKPLASVLQTIDEEGGLLDKFKESDFFKSTMDTLDSWKESLTKLKDDIASIIPTLDDIKTAIESFKTTVDKLLVAINTIISTVQSAYDSVNAYIDKFDTDGDGSLDPEEKEALFTSMKEKASTYITDFFKDTMMAIGGMLLTATFITKTAALAFASIKPIFAATSFVGPMAAGAAAAGSGVATLLPIAGLLLYGVTTTWSNISDSIKTTIEEEGSVSFSGFFANFFGGDDKGGFMNAMRQAFKIGGTFALVGMGIGAVLGAGVLSVPFALIGGLIGMGVGLLVGALGGALGSAKIKTFMVKMGDMISDTVDAIGGFFGDVIAGFKSFFKGQGFMTGYNDSRYKDKSDAERKLMDLQDEIAALQGDDHGYTKERAAELLIEKRAKEQDMLMYIEDAPQQGINDARAKLEKRNANLRKMIEANNKFGGDGTEEMNRVMQRELAINMGDLQRMPAYKDTMRTEMKNAELELEAQRKAAALAKNNELYSTGTLGQQIGLIDAKTITDNKSTNNINSFHGSQLRATDSRYDLLPHLINLNNSLAGQ